MAPSRDTSLHELNKCADIAGKSFSNADLSVRILTGFFGFTAAAQLTTFALISPDRLLIGFSLLSAIAALSLWTIGKRYVDQLEAEFLRREKAIDEYLNLPVS